jgi:hypothetical protein
MRKLVLAVVIFLAGLAGLAAYALRPQPKPEYAWLVFGSAARVGVLVTLHGEATTLEHYLDAQPTGRREQFTHRLECKDIVIADPDGQSTYTITSMSGSMAGEGIPTELFVSVHVQGARDFHQYSDQTMTGALAAAPQAHFAGPLTVEVKKINGQLHPGLALRRGDRPIDLQVMAGTVDFAKGCWVAVRTDDRQGNVDFAPGVHPYVEVEFPPRHAGDPPLQRRYALDKVC